MRIPCANGVLLWLKALNFRQFYRWFGGIFMCYRCMLVAGVQSLIQRQVVCWDIARKSCGEFCHQIAADPLFRCRWICRIHQ